MPKALNLEGTMYPEVWAQLSRVSSCADTSSTLPAACYSDTLFFEYEKQCVFHNSWVSIGRDDKFKGTGSYVTMELANIPLIILRDQKGLLKAFANTCRHRGTALLENKGRVRSISCPFHGWTYDLNGVLIAAPKMEHLELCGKRDFNLISFPIKVKDGFAFINLSKNALTIDKWLGNFSTFHAPWEMSNFKITHHREFEVSCNWKLFLDVFCEWYHLPYVHSKLVGGHYGVPEPIDEVIGNYCSQFGQIEGRGGLSGEFSKKEHQERAFPMIPSLKGKNQFGGRYSWVFPNLVFSTNPDSLWLYVVSPITPSRTRVEFSFCFPSATTKMPDFKKRAEFYYTRLQTAVEEDIIILERQQKGLSVPFQRSGRYCASLEPMVANFAHWYAKTLLAMRKKLL